MPTRYVLIKHMPYILDTELSVRRAEYALWKNTASGSTCEILATQATASEVLDLDDVEPYETGDVLHRPDQEPTTKLVVDFDIGALEGILLTAGDGACSWCKNIDTELLEVSVKDDPDVWGPDLAGKTFKLDLGRAITCMLKRERRLNVTASADQEQTDLFIQYAAFGKIEFV